MSDNRVLSIFGGKSAKIAAILLILQIIAFYSLAGQEKVLPDATLTQVPAKIGNWSQTGADIPIEQEILDTLKADQVLSRTYATGPGVQDVSLFVAFFKSQRAGASPHSPKVCLPGSGWVPRDSSTAYINVAGYANPIPVNRYIVTRGEYKSLVLYWYQSANRVVANEYAAKMYLMADGVRYRRSDTSLVRVIVPVRQDQSDAEAEQIGTRFVQELFQPLRSHLPA
jgi:EpsI family protein